LYSQRYHRYDPILFGNRHKRIIYELSPNSQKFGQLTPAGRSLATSATSKQKPPLSES
jgi:hypothetical protein